MKSSKPSDFKTSSIGVIAADALSKYQSGQVFGKTSKGIFLKTPGRWIIFLSFERFKGPLTITLEEFDPVLRQAAIGDPVQITTQAIFLPEQDIGIAIADSPIWKPAHPPPSLLGDAERHEKLLHFAKEVLSKKHGIGLSSLIPPILGLPDDRLALYNLPGLHQVDIEQLQACIRNCAGALLSGLLIAALGSGPGLTPSYDDFVVGLLLSLNRWQNPLWKAGDLRDLNLPVIQAAYDKTTTLSANLIECASMGLANERLINALDWIMTGEEPEPKVIEHLLGWGNSSGVDTFAGMAAVLAT